MGKQVLLIGCLPDLERELHAHCGAGLLETTALPDLRDPRLLDLLRAADIVVLCENAAPRDLPKICTHLRGQTSRPLLVALRDTPEAAVTEVLEAGADDAVAATMSPREFLARIRAHLRRDQEYANGHVRPAVAVGELHLDSARHEVLVRGEPVNLTPREFELLEHLVRQAGRAVRRGELLEEVWGYNSQMTTRTLDVHIGRLRQKIERRPQEPEIIVTVPGVGYKLQAR
ncbi:MAG: response regulator transcription factor [Armatimonadetes bacterium]|nr:response regulator transcription factor [Armatimonadota bacterium]